LSKVVNERFNNSQENLKDILEFYKNNTVDIKYFSSEKSNWFNKDLILELLERRNKYEKIFAEQIYNKNPVQISAILPQKVLNNIIYKTEQLKFFSPISLKLKVKLAY